MSSEDSSCEAPGGPGAPVRDPVSYSMRQVEEGLALNVLMRFRLSWAGLKSWRLDPGACWPSRFFSLEVTRYWALTFLNGLWSGLMWSGQRNTSLMTEPC